MSNSRYGFAYHAVIYVRANSREEADAVIREQFYNRYYEDMDGIPEDCGEIYEIPNGSICFRSRVGVGEYDYDADRGQGQELSNPWAAFRDEWFDTHELKEIL